MRSCFKVITYRNPKILDAARRAPRCMLCGMGREGEMVGCHSNELQDGHGSGHKAHDVVAFLCGNCHSIIDGRDQGLNVLPRQERQFMFLRAVYNSMLWLLETGEMRKVA